MRSFLTGEWRDLLMLNYEVDPALLTPHVPRGTELDLWKGAALVSLVGFHFRDTRVLGVAVPGHRDFEEVNLRFYVKRGGKRAVVFIRELVPRRAIAWTARIAYNEPYVAVPMRHEIDETNSRRALRYEWRSNGDWVGLKAWTSGPAMPLRTASEAEFITEHYWGYTRQRDGGTIEYRVDHPRWRVWTAMDAQVTGDISETHGRDFASALSGPPRSAFVAEGSAITVSRPLRLARD
jgi:uncharacterized protein YqjF (DUF2071 family)